MTAHFLHLQHSTCNWTKPDSANETWCQCPLEKLRHRQVDLIDLLSKSLFFCLFSPFLQVSIDYLSTSSSIFINFFIYYYQSLCLYLSLSSSISINHVLYIVQSLHLYLSISSSLSINLFIYIYQSLRLRLTTPFVYVSPISSSTSHQSLHSTRSLSKTKGHVL